MLSFTTAYSFHVISCGRAGGPSPPPHTAGGPSPLSGCHRNKGSICGTFITYKTQRKEARALETTISVTD